MLPNAINMIPTQAHSANLAISETEKSTKANWLCSKRYIGTPIWMKNQSPASESAAIAIRAHHLSMAFLRKMLGRRFI